MENFPIFWETIKKRYGGGIYGLRIKGNLLWEIGLTSWRAFEKNLSFIGMGAHVTKGNNGVVGQKMKAWVRK